MEFALEHEFRGVELSGEHFWPEALSSADITWLQLRAARDAIRYSIHFLHGAVPATHHTRRWDDCLRQMRQTIALAKDLGAPVIVLHPGPVEFPGMDPKHVTGTVRSEAIGNLARFLHYVAREAESANVAICLENTTPQPGETVQSYAQLARVVESADSPAIGITLDISNATERGNLKEAVALMKPHIRHLHLSDCKGGKGHLEIGTGDVKLEDYAPLIAVDGPQIATMEINAAGDREGALLRSRDALKARFGMLLT